MRLNDTERGLLHSWNKSKKYPYPTLRRILVKSGSESSGVDNPGLRGIQELEINFGYPLTVICGKNGSGKSTILALAALGFHSPNGHVPMNASRKPKQGEDFTYYTFRDFFFKGPGDPDITGVGITWKYLDTDRIQNELSIRKQSAKWMRYERRPKRPVHHLGAFRVIPAIEQNVLRSHFGSTRTHREPKILNEDFRTRFSNIMNRTYDEVDIIQSDKYSIRGCQFGSTYCSSFNLGSGEDIVINLLYQLQQCPEGSLIIIEEIELGLHPEALVSLARHLQEIMLKKKLQVIVSTHSTYFIDNVPREARILVQRAEKEHSVTYGPTTRFAMGLMSGKATPELLLYCEDHFAALLIERALSSDLRRRTSILPVGSNSEIAKQATHHLRAHLGQHILLIWDGDDVTQRDANDWIKNEKDELKKQGSHPENSLIPDWDNRVNWGFLPGESAPEAWTVDLLDCDDGYRLLSEEIGCDNHHARILIEKLRVVSEHHDIGYKLMEEERISSEDAALRMLVKSVFRLPEKPLKDVSEMVSAVLNSKRVRGGEIADPAQKGG